MSHHQAATTATSRQEAEMVNRTQRELQKLDNSGDPTERLRLLCLSRGASGVLRLGRLVRIMDEDGKNKLNRKQFEHALKGIGLDITEHEAKDMFTKFNTDGYGSVNIDEFLLHIRPPMAESRKRVIEEAFNKMDKSGDGEITIGDLKHLYNVNANPMYIAGEESEYSIARTFLDNFEEDATIDSRVTKEEFFNYYSGVSASIENDCYFDLMMRQAYKL